jgi:fatty-acyl-CoA synthase
VIIINGDLVRQLTRILPQCPTVRDVIVVGDREGSLEVSPVQVHDYDELLAAADPVPEWPRLPERNAGVLCNTTGTTGAPRRGL